MNVSIRPLREEDLAAADGIMRLAFGTFLGLPDPMSFTGDAAYVHSRWRADPTAAFAAEAGGEIGGSNFAANWGSVGLLGPITTRPDLWDRGIGRRLMQPVLERFEQWGARHYGLFTFAHSQKHVGLYQKFGFWPQFLTAIMAKTVAPGASRSSPAGFSDVPGGEQHKVLDACRKLTDAIYEGLDLRAEVLAVARHGLPLRPRKPGRQRHLLREVWCRAFGSQGRQRFPPVARCLRAAGRRTEAVAPGRRRQHRAP